MDGETVVLTGVSGCLGHQTLKLLISDDELVREIRCLDLHKPEKSKLHEIELELEAYKSKAGNKKHIKWIQGDIRDINVVEQALCGANCVIHCAAKIEIWIDNEKQNATELESVNVDGTENLLKAAIRFGVHKFIHVSSFETFASYHTIYYATESTLPETDNCLFGTSAKTKKQAELKVKLYSNNKLAQIQTDGKDSLNAVIIRLPPIYGEHDRHYVSKIIEVTKYFGGTLQRWSNIWIRQQPIYVGNAAWSLIKAKQRMETDQSISGEEFHVTDDTTIGDPFDFLEPYIECKGMKVTKNSYPFLPAWILMAAFFITMRFLSTLDVFGLFTKKKGRLQEAIEKDELRLNRQAKLVDKPKPKRWYEVITPQIFFFMCNSTFLNRTKASLRLDYEPLYSPEESKLRSIEWYKKYDV